jgi:hypothetical protein
VAADDDVAHAERDDGIFHGGRHATVHGGIGRHHVAGVAAHEQVAGLRLHDLFGHDARSAHEIISALGAWPWVESWP